MIWGADDYGENVSGYPTYRKGDAIFDRFPRHDGIFRYNLRRSLLHAHYI
jgi:hypothetical protein